MHLKSMRVLILSWVFITGLTSAWAEDTAVMAFPEKRRYWDGCNEKGFETLAAGMPQIQARLLCSGQEFVPFESIRKGFRFAINRNHKAFVTVPGWLPEKEETYDFFCTPNLVLIAQYDDELNVKLVTHLPNAKSKKK